MPAREGPPIGGGRVEARRVLFDDGRLRVIRNGESALLLCGEIDLSNSERLGAIMADALSPGGVVLVDLTDLSFIDLSGLRVLELVPCEGPMPAVRVRNVPPFVRRLLTLITGRPDDLF
ncbi:STAS domain-containing protein [Spongiactinospora sp. TRM90649]|uniref:STAS domain-containing protein n=1 Tax=Spongiactinospora sp. TRM90649 TaxID=3031114 RepID=UPI0023F70403|nr:STAS domain-containing protein [Spongiactinospora sp. TRM90649]MDF5758547.1 STAS domain-containing protein [Spongiactinospora sp. TRM90649]